MKPQQQRPEEAGRSHPTDLDDHVTRIIARQRLLLEMLFDARDALVRRSLDSDDRTDRQPSSRRGKEEPPPAPSPDPRGYADLCGRIREVSSSTIPSGSRVAVVSRGDARLLDLGLERQAWHFPREPDGRYAGHHPADSRAAIEHLEDLRRAGMEFLVFPATAMWWLDHYTELARHLDRRYPAVADDAETCVVYDLRERPVSRSRSIEDADGALPRDMSRRSLAAVTIISRNYLAQARVLARTFREHEPDSRFYLLVVDRLPEGVDVGVDVQIIEPAELDIPNLYDMCFKYGIVEFNTAVKPYLLSLLLRKYDESEVVYFDPDIMIMRPLDELREALTRGSIVLTPHIMSPLPSDGRRPSEQDIMISGAYNLGFIAIRRSPETEDFLRWWEERLQDGCRIDVQHGLFTDQKWIDLVPSLFPAAVILRDPTYNVAFWNLHERSIGHDGGDFVVNERPAAFFHISGFDPEDPRTLSKHQTRIEVKEGTALAELLDTYAELLLANGYREARQWEYGYARFENGIRVHPLLRQIYLNLLPEERNRFGDPFSTREADSFLDWATRPRPEDGDLSLFLQAIYQVRYDLPLTFPDVRGRDRAAFVNWARRWGSKEMNFEPELVRDRELPGSTPSDGLGPTPEKADAADRRQPKQTPIPPRTDQSPRMAYEAVVERIRDVARSTLPAGSQVLVISRGDYRLLDLGGSEGWHFPQTENGVYGGYHPPTSNVAIAHLEALRAKGADYLLIPQTALWWLEYYDDFRRHLEKRYRPVVWNHESCVIYSLRDATNGDRASRSGAPRWRRWLTRIGNSLVEGGAR